MPRMNKFKLISIFIWPLVVLIVVFGTFYLKPWQKTQNTISVSAEGKIEVVPNIAKITATISSQNQNIDVARQEVENKVSNVVTKLKELGIEEKDIKTQRISAGPDYEIQTQIYPVPLRPKTNQVSNTLEVTIRDFKKADGVLALLTQNGASNLYGPNLTVDDETLEKAKSQAREKAVENAKTKAGELAKLSQRKLGKIITIKEQGNFRIPEPLYAQSSSDLSEKASQIQPGQNEVSISLLVDFALK